MIGSLDRWFRRTAVSARRFTPRLEALEDRTLPATYLLLDYTPDSHSGGLRDTFYQVKTRDGRYAPSFFDFNRDGWVNDTDVNLAANAIAYKTQLYFNNFLGLGVHVRFGDVLSDTRLGTQWINWGRSSADYVAVMYLGGTNRGGMNILGMAPLASNGYNVEGFGETYTRALAQYLINSYPAATTTDFVNATAQTVAHEFGHMLGLRHTVSHSTYNIMSPTAPSNPGATYFVNGTLAVQGGGTQNASYELTASFRGQWSQGGIVNLGGQALHAHDAGHGEHEHEHEHEGWEMLSGPGGADDGLTGPAPGSVLTRHEGWEMLGGPGSDDGLTGPTLGSVLTGESDLATSLLLLAARRAQETGSRLPTTDARFVRPSLAPANDPPVDSTEHTATGLPGGGTTDVTGAVLLGGAMGGVTADASVALFGAEDGGPSEVIPLGRIPGLTVGV